MDLERALEEQKQQTEPANPPISGLLGIPLGGQRRVEVPNRNAYVYVRLRANQSEVIQAYNNQVSPSYNLPVLLQRQGNRYTVIGLDTQRYENNWKSQSPFLPRHGNTHSFDIESGGGGDIVWVYPRQFMPALVFPSGSSGAMDVIVSPYILQNANGSWKYTGATGTVNLTPYIPTSPTGAIMALVYLDAPTGNPFLLVNSGTVFSNTITGSSLLVPYIPSVSNTSTQIPLAAIRLITGTSRLSWDNIYDVRQWIHTVPTGSAGGSVNPPVTGSIVVQDEGVLKGSVTILNFVGDGVDASVSGSVARIFVTGSTGGGSPLNTGVLDARYLKLDASNDPVTGELDLIIDSLPVNGRAFTVLNRDTDTAKGATQIGSVSGSWGGYIYAKNNTTLYLDQIFRVGHSTPTTDEAVIYASRYQEDSSPASKSNIPAFVVDDFSSTMNYYGGTLKHLVTGSVFLLLNPQATGSVVPYILDSQYPKPTGTSFLSLRIQGIEKFAVDTSGTARSNGSPLIKEAPVDSQEYIRKNAGWDTGTYLVPFGVFANISPMTVDGAPYGASIHKTMTFIRWSQSFNVITTNNGSNYWRIKLLKNDGTLIKQIDTSASAVNTWSLLVATTFDVASAGTSDTGLQIATQKVGAPGGLYLLGVTLEVK